MPPPPRRTAGVRGGDFDRLIRNIEMLQDMRKRAGVEVPWVSMSMVAMADNIEELPDFVSLSHRIGALRVYVENLTGWHDDPRGNYPATDNPRCSEFVQEARRRAEELDIRLKLTTGLEKKDGATPTNGAAPPKDRQHLPHCSWLAGVDVQRDGGLEPCCLVHRVADLGSISDGPLLENEKYRRVKDLLLVGKVFERCAEQRNCEYVQQQLSAGIPLEIITPAELGDLAPAPRAAAIEADADAVVCAP